MQTLCFPVAWSNDIAYPGFVCTVTTLRTRMAPQKVTPTMPGSAPQVLVMPSSSDACRGDRSAWLLYSPASENADRPWDAEISAATHSIR